MPTSALSFNFVLVYKKYLHLILCLIMINDLQKFGWYKCFFNKMKLE